ncbi:beta-ketoacyl-ACP synthase II [bacterium]|nr:beta-ketoacyl-ACP synthase II [bacterium]NIN92160.1 beta-ketoacyl-ACP synthase II [bacterium]NIO18818.1 beta-ketoacyl-ACP synthase II [bacterium]NIO73902.1 beta-ketoacyl-ACP synthase II [bacterium]
MDRRVVITGYGVVSPIGIGIDDFWNSLISGKSGITKVSSFDASQFSTKICAEVKDFEPEKYIDKKKIRKMDRFSQLAFAAAKMAMENAKLDMQKEDPFRVGVIVGSGIGGLSTVAAEHRVLLEKGPRRVSPFMIPMLITNIAAGEIAIAYNIQGPNYSLSSACATSNHTVGDALRLIRYGDADVIIAGGSEAAVTPLGLAGFCSAKALSTRNDDPEHASRPFDKERDGFVMGEGAGIVILEALQHALSRGATIRAELIGYGATDDAYHVTAPSPDGQSAARAMSNALADGGVKPEEVDYINAHGTSTPLNDKTETLAIKKVFGDYAYKIPISSNKSMIGHLLGAAGVVELIATILSIEREMIPPTINYEFPDPDCDLDYVPNKARPKKINVALSNSLGFGGHNATLVVKKYRPER